MVVGVLHHLFGEGDVILEGLGGGVDHDGGKAAVNAAFADLKIRAVIEVQGDGQAGIGLGGLHELDEIDVLGILARAGGHLQDQGGIHLRCGLGDALDDLHIVHVERADGIAAFIGFPEHFLRRYDWHDITLLIV